MELGYRLEYPSWNKDGVDHLRRLAREFSNPDRLALSDRLRNG
jgi:hypothetical protein